MAQNDDVYLYSVHDWKKVALWFQHFILPIRCGCKTPERTISSTLVNMCARSPYMEFVTRFVSNAFEKKNTQSSAAASVPTVVTATTWTLTATHISRLNRFLFPFVALYMTMCTVHCIRDQSETFELQQVASPLRHFRLCVNVRYRLCWMRMPVCGLYINHSNKFFVYSPAFMTINIVL